MIVLEIILQLAIVAPAQLPPRVDTAGTEATIATAIDALVIDASVAEIVALEAAVRLRIGDCPVSRSDRARQPREGELFAYLEVTPAADNRTTLRLTLGDARAWVRTIDAPAEDRTREIATTVGNLFAGIEVDDIAPDLRDVPLPPPLQPAAPIARPVAPRPVTPPRLEWGIGTEGLVILGLGAPPPADLAAGGVALRGGVRWRRGALVTGGVRAGFLRERGYTMTRVRVDIGGGHALHRGAFVLHTTLGVTVEPWLVTTSGSVPDTERRPVGTLLGGVLRLSPMWRARIGARHLAIGPFAELAGSGMPGDGIPRVRTMPGTDGVDVFRAGGLELAAGLLITLWSKARR